MKSLTITRPDDWHCHLREGRYLSTTVPDTARTFARAIVMPNLEDPVTNVNKAHSYRDAILQQIPEDADFTPLMTLYLTAHTTINDVEAAKTSGFIYGVKLYPAGVTTGSDAGVTELTPLYPVFERMAALGLPLLIHGESRDPKIDVFDRERVFIETALTPLCETIPTLKIVLEHITTKEAVDFVSNHGPNLGATITAHHLLYNRNDLLSPGIKPHLFCLPILKRSQHQSALIAAATSGNPKFFLGTDSAPHTIAQKESKCGCAGIYSAPYALPFYAEVFEHENKLDQLEKFASHHGADFYGLPRNQDTIRLIQKSQSIPQTLAFGHEQVIPMGAGTQLTWSVQ